MSFSGEDDKRLIENVSNHIVLYNPSHKDYKNTLIRDSIWSEISSQFHNKSDEDCKKRWRCIRDTYKRLKKSGKLSSGSAARKKRPWPLGAYLTFLDASSEELSTVSNVHDTSQDYNQEPNDAKETLIEDISDICDISYNSPIVSVDSPSTPESSTPSTSTFRRTARVTKNKVDHKINVFLKESKKERNKIIRLLTTEKSNVDEVDMFYKSISMSVKKLPKDLISVAKIRHLQILHELEMQALGKQPFTKPTF